MNEQKKNILLIITNLDFGGAQTSFSKLSTALSDSFNVINVVFSRDRMADYSFGAPLLDLGIERPTTWLGKSINFWRRVRRLRKIKRQYKIDISISFLEGADYMNILSAIGEKIVVSIRGSKQFDQNIRGLAGYIRKSWLMPYFYNKASVIVAVNKGIAEELTTNFGVTKPIEVIYNFYDFEKLKINSQDSVGADFQKWITESHAICIMGRLAPEKGIDKFLPVYAEVKKRLKNCKLFLIGAGPDQNSLMKQSSELGLVVSDSISKNADVFFMGYQLNPHKYLSHCSVLVMPSLHEGFPNALLEAMALSVPVVSADCPHGPREILEDEKKQFSGLLLPVLTDDGAESKWIEELSSFLVDEQRKQKLIELGGIRANEFSSKRSLHKWLNILEN